MRTSLSRAMTRCAATRSATDPGVELALMLLDLIPESSDERGGVRPVHPTAETAQTLRRLRGATTHHELIVPDLDRQPVPCLDTQAAAGLAWYGDLALGTYLGA